MNSRDVLNPVVATYVSQHVVYLDPREDACQSGAVWIPLSQLHPRMQELPPKTSELLILDWGDVSRQALEFVQHGGRRVSLVDPAEVPAKSGPLRLWQPNAFLMEVLPSLEPGYGVDFGCGTGREAIALSCCGWKVTAIDRLQDAVDRAQDLGSKYGGEGVEWRQAYVEQMEPFEPESIDLACIFYYLSRPLIRQIVDWLAPGGSLVVETFTQAHREAFGKPASDDFVLQMGELPTLVPELEVLEFREGLHGDRYTARLWARKSTT